MVMGNLVMYLKLGWQLFDQLIVKKQQFGNKKYTVRIYSLNFESLNSTKKWKKRFKF